MMKTTARGILSTGDANVVISAQVVIPAEAGIQLGLPPSIWIPACAGMTVLILDRR